ncbi:MAG: hypothetical protein PWP04_714 [Candidatus Atribacteria bacterium]|nr:hypothetical protein [Candidatus Atribacteria bacterium]
MNGEKGQVWHLNKEQAQVKETGFVELLLVSLVGVVLLISLALIREVILHRRVVDAHVEKVKTEYQTEGVLVEAISYLEKQKPDFEGEKSSTFAPDFSFIVGDEKITVMQNGRSLLEAQFTWEENKIKITKVESWYNLPYSR